MDLTLGLLGVLGVVGYNFRSKRENEREKRISISPHSSPNGITAYESKDYVKHKKNEQKTLDAFHKNSVAVRGTNIIGTSYNKANADKKKVVPEQKRFQGPHDLPPQSMPEYPSKVFAGPMFNMSLNYLDYKGEDTAATLKESFTDKRNFSKLSGSNINITHENMTPFFGSHSNMELTNNSKTILDRHNGEAKIRKTETANQINGPVDNVNGTPLYRPELSRFIKSDKQTNVLPFDQIREKPIPQEFTRVMPKTLEELRVGAVNQKLSYGGRIIRGLEGSNRGFVGEFNKNKPDRYYDQRDPLPTRSANPEASPITNFKDALRNTENKQLLEDAYNIGIVQRGDIGFTTRVNTKDDGQSTIYQGDTKNTYKKDWIRNHKNDTKRDTSIQYTYHAKEQERETTSRQDLIGFKGDDAMVRHLDDVAKTTNKQNVLYEYSGNIENPGAYAPQNRNQYNNAEMITKPSREYTTGGLMSTNKGKEFVNINQRDTPSVQNYKGVGSSNIKKSTKSLGRTTYTYNPSEHNFSDRIITKQPINSLVLKRA